MGEPDTENATAGIRELKTHLSAYLRRVRAGESITITDRGTPIARILPAGASTREKMKALEEAGIGKWSGEKLQPQEPIAENRGDRMISDLLLEDRR